MVISIIIPVYNSEKYLIKCLDSVVKECEGLDYECILIDDGSRDNSGYLCDEFSRYNKNFKVIHKQNEGLSCARNCGILNATGDYVLFIDSDDYLAEGGVHVLVDTVRDTELDVVCGNFYIKTQNSLTLLDKEPHDTIYYNGSAQAMEALIEGVRFQNHSCGKLFRKDLVQKHPFIKGKSFEDVYWFYHIVHDANSIAVVSNPVFYYIQHKHSMSHTYSLKYLDLLDAYAERHVFLYHNYPDLVAKHSNSFAEVCVDTAWKTIYLNIKDRKTATGKVRSIIKRYILTETAIMPLLRKQLSIYLKNVLGFYLFVILHNRLKRLTK